MMFQKGDLIKAKHQYKRYNGGTLALMLGDHPRTNNQTVVVGRWLCRTGMGGLLWFVGESK